MMAACAATLLVSPARANDAIAAVGVGGIVFRQTDAIAMKKEVLSVSHNLITVDYEFLNESSSDLDETIVFPLPAYPAATQTSDSYYGQPARFSIKVDGKAVGYTTRVIALQGGKDVTAQLKKAGLTDAQIAYNPSFAAKAGQAKLTAGQWDRLVKIGLINERDDGDMGPAWDIQVNYVWQQKFPVNKVVRVHHAYSPFVAAGPGASWIDPGFKKRYCADSAFFDAYEMAGARNNDYVNAAHVEYILQTGNKWKRGIEDFTLNVIKARPSEIISLCFPGTFKKLNATTYQVRLANFKPSDDLRIYFGNVDFSGQDNEGVMPVPVK